MTIRRFVLQSPGILSPEPRRRLSHVISITSRLLSYSDSRIFSLLCFVLNEKNNKHLNDNVCDRAFITVPGYIMIISCHRCVVSVYLLLLPYFSANKDYQTVQSTVILYTLPFLCHRRIIVDAVGYKITNRSIMWSVRFTGV